jgi:hypothetical protein
MGSEKRILQGYADVQGGDEAVTRGCRTAGRRSAPEIGSRESRSARADEVSVTVQRPRVDRGCKAPVGPEAGNLGGFQHRSLPRWGNANEKTTSIRGNFCHSDNIRGGDGMRIVIWGEPRLGERIGGLIALGSVFVTGRQRLEATTCCNRARDTSAGPRC